MEPSPRRIWSPRLLTHLRAAQISLEIQRKIQKLQQLFVFLTSQFCLSCRNTTEKCSGEKICEATGQFVFMTLFPISKFVATSTIKRCIQAETKHK